MRNGVTENTFSRRGMHLNGDLKRLDSPGKSGAILCAPADLLNKVLSGIVTHFEVSILNFKFRDRRFHLNIKLPYFSGTSFVTDIPNAASLKPSRKNLYRNSTSKHVKKGCSNANKDRG